MTASNNSYLKGFFALVLLVSACASPTADIGIASDDETGTPSASPSALHEAGPRESDLQEGQANAADLELNVVGRESLDDCRGDFVFETYEEAIPFEGLQTWRESADVVAIVTITGVEAAEKMALDNGAYEYNRNVTMTLDEVLLGEAETDDGFTIRSHERLRPGESQCFTLIPGRRAMVALIGDGISTEDSALLTQDSVLIINGSAPNLGSLGSEPSSSDELIVRTGRPSPVVEFEGLALEGVVDMITEAE